MKERICFDACHGHKTNVVQHRSLPLPAAETGVNLSPPMRASSSDRLTLGPGKASFCLSLILISVYPEQLPIWSGGLGEASSPSDGPWVKGEKAFLDAWRDGDCNSPYLAPLLYGAAAFPCILMTYLYTALSI